MDITAAAQEHRTLVSQRAELIARAISTRATPEEINLLVKPLDSRIGHLAQAFNPRIAVKAQKWLTKGV